MSEEQLIAMREHLAVKVMNFTSVQSGPYWYWVNENDRPATKVSDFKPDEDIKQSMMVLDTFRNVAITKIDKEYNVHIHESTGSFLSETNESLPLAICIAACRATGMEI